MDRVGVGLAECNQGDQCFTRKGEKQVYFIAFGRCAFSCYSSTSCDWITGGKMLLLGGEQGLEPRAEALEPG
jgi:hypothetical protein